MTKDAHTWREIISQPQIWRATLDAFDADQATLERFLDRTEFDQILVTGCGSTHYLSQAAAATLAHCTDVPARAVPSSEVWLFPDLVPTDRTLLLAVSRSGATTETLRALGRFREVSGGPVVAITCYPESPLAQQADLAMAAPDAQERSIAQTRSFTSLLLLSQALATTMAHDAAMLEHLRRLPDALDSLTLRMEDLSWQLGTDLDIERLFFLGGGPLYGLANEAMLKTKEMSLSHSAAYHPLEFRHGPMSMVNERTLVVGLLSDTSLTEESRVLKDMRELGARTLALVEDAADDEHPLAMAERPADHIVELRSGLNEWERGPLYLPVLQRIAYHRAVAKGLDPDHPHNLSAVVEL